MILSYNIINISIIQDKGDITNEETIYLSIYFNFHFFGM